MCVCLQLSFLLVRFSRNALTVGMCLNKNKESRPIYEVKNFAYACTIAMDCVIIPPKRAAVKQDNFEY